MNYIQQEQRYWELTYGTELVTCYIGNKKIYLHNYRLKYIFETLGVEKYLHLCGISGFKNNQPSGLSQLEIEKLNKEIILNYAIFLHEFVQCDSVQYDVISKEFRIKNNSDEFTLSDNEMNELFDNFREIYCLGDSSGKDLFENAKPITEEGKQDLDFFRKAAAKINSQQNGSHTIDSIIMGITAKHPSYNLLNIFDLTIWQLIKTHSAMYKMDDIYFTKIGIYTGNIDTQKSKIKPKELDWSTRTN